MEPEPGDSGEDDHDGGGQGKGSQGDLGGGGKAAYKYPPFASDGHFL
ncbi:MAG TPA: hypothetical protein VMH90_04875 [Thermoplasmata archaeon]|nr:hypothetical protein [Thermoplasmata archaeon]